MNFFGHLFAARWAPARAAEAELRFGLGTMFPDLLPMCGAQPAQPLPDAVAAGIAFHHRTDAAFHECASFVELMRDARTWLLDHAVARGPALGAAHVGVELLLDGMLAADEDEARFRDALAARVQWRSPADAARFSALCRGLLAAGVPGSYADPPAVATRLVRILDRRPRLRLDESGAQVMQQFAETFAPRVRERTPEILEQLRGALTAA